MADITMGGGREITFDLEKITISEYEELLDSKITRQREKEILSKPCGLTVEEVKGLSLPDYKKLAKAFVLKAVSPVDQEATEKN
jgi:hypothetical protein